MMKNFFAQQLNILLEKSLRPDGKRHTYESIAEASNGVITPSYLTRLRNGKAKPGYDVIKSLAKVFHVNPNYFFDLEESSNESSPNADPDIAQITFRAGRLDEEDKKAILGMIKHIEKIRQEKDDSE